MSIRMKIILLIRDWKLWTITFTTIIPGKARNFIFRILFRLTFIFRLLQDSYACSDSFLSFSAYIIHFALVYIIIKTSCFKVLVSIDIGRSLFTVCYIGLTDKIYKRSHYSLFQLPFYFSLISVLKCFKNDNHPWKIATLWIFIWRGESQVSKRSLVLSFTILQLSASDKSFL